MHTDTDLEAAHLRIVALRRMGGEKRLRQALELSEAIHRLAAKGQQDRLQPTPTEASSGTA